MKRFNPIRKWATGFLAFDENYHQGLQLVLTAEAQRAFDIQNESAEIAKPMDEIFWVNEPCWRGGWWKPCSLVTVYDGGGIITPISSRIEEAPAIVDQTSRP